MSALSDAEAQRIISHMNKDHPHDLALYIRGFGCIDESEVSNAKLVEFTSSKMVITYGKVGQYVHLFPEQMKAGEARVKLHDLSDAANKALGYSPVKLNSVVLTRGAAVALLLATLLQGSLILASTSQLEQFVPWSLRYAASLLEKGNLLPTISNTTVAAKTLLLAPIWAIHIAEYYLYLIPLFKKHKTTDIATKLQYFIATTIAGVPIWSSFKKIGQEQERALFKKQ